MRWPLTFLSLLASCGPVDGALPARGTDNGVTVFEATCADDSACPGGMVCEGCNGPHDAVCIPGCRTDTQCPRRHVCRGPVQCTTCPCPPGWCELDPCRDDDRDGFAFTRDPAISCPGKAKNDCNDLEGEVHPDATEWCANGIDDDCDGKTDSADESCQRCEAQSVRCDDSTVCNPPRTGVVQCQAGCCASCPALEPVQCTSTEWQVGGGLDARTGCRVRRTCIDRARCPATQVLCGVDYATYRSPCEADLVGVARLHHGSCQYNEGFACPRVDVGARGSCAAGQYCRLDAEAGPRCTLVGACRVDADCPAGQSTTPCPDGSPRRYTCMTNACLSSCG